MAISKTKTMNENVNIAVMMKRTLKDLMKNTQCMDGTQVEI